MVSPSPLGAARATVGSTWTDVEGVLVHARVSVAGRADGMSPVVLVHGIGVSSRHMIPTAERLAPFAAVYAPDLPGFGRSAKPPVVFDVPRLADALRSWMRAAGLERAALVGNSFGCQIVVDFAVRHGEHAERLVLVGPTTDPNARTVLGQMRRWLHDGLYEAPSLALVLVRDYRDAGARRIVRTFEHALGDAIEDKLPHVRVPVLVVRGGRDPIVPQRWADEVTRLLPLGRLVVVPGAPHAVNYSAPLELVRIIRPFLKETAT